MENFVPTHQIGFVKWGFTLAFHFLKQQTSYYDAIKQTVQLGGDTDTNAAIVGGLIGAKEGLEKLPSDMVNKMIKYKFKDGDKIGYRRPEFLSPNNLVKRLDILFENSK